MKFTKTKIPDVILIEPDVVGDDRGFFMETWKADVFKAEGINAEFVQDNHSKSSQGILRGLHYQIKKSQGKLVRVVVGEVYDVAVDMRKNSGTFGQWVGENLSADNKKMLWVPPGFAHGFYVISDKAEFIYKCSDYYAPEYERSVKWNDPDLAITWPLVAGQHSVLSKKDAAAKLFCQADSFDDV